ncbi:hypothetical protein K3495_g11267, partial [Podosphaera aphanis]
GAGKFSKENNTIKNKNQFYRSQLNEEPSEYPHVQRNPSFYLSTQPTQQYESPNRVPTHELATLSRIYRDEDRYGGSEDCLDLCLGIFHDTCRKAGICRQFFREAFSIMLKGSAREYYHMYLLSEELSFDEMIIRIKTHFETAERQRLMMSKWRNITLRRTIEQNPSKSKAECFEMIVLQLRKVQLGLPDRFRGDLSLRDAMIDAVRDIRECSLACYKPAATFEALCADIRASIATEEYFKNNASLPASKSSYPLSPEHIHHQLYTDHRYGGGKMKQKEYYTSSRNSKKCFVCKKEGCWSSKHTPDEKNKAFKAFKERLRMHNNLMMITKSVNMS